MVKVRSLQDLCLILGTLVGILLLAVSPKAARAGVYNADGEVTYKEYWALHTIEAGYTGGCPVPVPADEKNRWYIEPGNLNSGCTKTLKINIPDNVQGALKAEIYVDLWRNQQQNDTSAARFRINSDATVYNPTNGDDWGRTPYVTQIPLTTLVQGENQVTFWTLTNKLFHAHDLLIRVYYDANHPLVAGSGSDVTPPDGQLTAIGGLDPNQAAVLTVDSNTLLLEATAGNGATLVEFHAFYEGYDEDNDGRYRDWHNRTVLNCFPGGVASVCAPLKSDLGATVDHIGTAAAVSPVAGDPRDDACSWGTTVSCTWNLGQIPNQAGVRFKVRISDAAGNVREAAGGVSAPFRLVRNSSTAVFTVPGFQSFPLKSNVGPTTAALSLNLPAGTRALYDKAYLVGSFWNNPLIRVNNSRQFDAFRTTESSWGLSVRDTTKTDDTIALINTIYDSNVITYTSRAQSFGEFIERPGPMLVLRRTTPGPADNTAPTGGNASPAPNSNDAREDTNLVLHVTDSGGVGVDRTSLVLRVNGQTVTGQTEITGFSNDYTLTYDPPGNLTHGETVSVAVDACDLRGNCMATYQYSFAIREAESTPPVISNLGVVVGPNYARITWITDEPATSVVDYGADSNYGLNFTNNALVKQHSVLLQGLATETLYHFRVRSADEFGNEAGSEDDIFQTRQSGPLVADDFNACQLDTNVWEFINPLDDATVSIVDGQKLKLTVPGGVAHEPQPTGPLSNAAPRIMQNAVDIDGMRVKFERGVNQVGQQQGVIVEQDANNYLRLVFAYVDGKTMFYAIKVGGTGGNTLKSYEFAPGAITGPIYLDIRYKPLDNRWRVTFSRYEDGSEGDPGGFNYALTVNKVGIFVGNSGGTGAPPVEAVIDYVEDTDTPLTNEDDTPLVVTADVWPVGKGTVTSEPACGTSVTLSAAAVPGWSFAGWSGIAVGNVATVTVPAGFGATAVANFVQDRYTVTANAVGNGTVVQSPVRPSYIPGSLVKFTANAAFGWLFNGWSHDGFGIATPFYLTVTQDSLVTGNFSEIRPVLTTTKVGNGTITVTPQRDDYAYQQQVSVTATADPGWRFAGWSGSMTSTDNTLTFNMVSDTALTATFVQEQYTLEVSHTGTGDVTVTPSKPTYVYGDAVTITAVPATGWRFAGWRGDNTGTNPTITLVMNGNQRAEATFVQNQYTLNVQTVGNGTVAVSPQKATYLHGDSVTLTATPAVGATFGGWTGAGSGSNPVLTLVIDGNKNVTATFVQNQYTLHVQTVGDGMVAVSPQKTTYAHGEAVTLTATPTAGADFVGWAGAGSGANPVLTLVMDGNKTVTATFTASQHILTVLTTGSGTVAASPQKTVYPHGEQVTLVASPATGWSFIGWTGDTSGNSNPVVLTMDADKTVTANFVEEVTGQAHMVVHITGGGKVSYSPQMETYPLGTEVTLTATPDAGWLFSGWSGDVTATTDAITVVMDGNKLVTAIFARQPVFLTTRNDGNGTVERNPQQTIYAYGDQVTLTAVPKRDYHFVGWTTTDATTGIEITLTENPLTVTLTANVAYEAHFAATTNRIFLPVVSR